MYCSTVTGSNTQLLLGVDPEKCILALHLVWVRNDWVDARSLFEN